MKTVQVARDLGEFERARVTAHELGHILRLDDDLDHHDAERVCNSFAAAFLRRPPSEREVSARAWAAIQERALERRREGNRAAARAR